MPEAPLLSASTEAGAQRATARTLLVSSVFDEEQAAQQLGREAYSYHFVSRAFTPLLQRWGEVRAITRPESRLDYAVWQAKVRNLQPLHLSFRPLHLTYLSALAPNIAFPFWEFPDIPDLDLD